MSAVPILDVPPGKCEPYVLPCYQGELWTIPTSNSTMRLLVTGNETQNTMAVVGTAGQKDVPIGFHFHREAHDVFLCLKGELNVWANDKARTLTPGDFASVPPGTVHQYQMFSSHTEFAGLIIPGGWEEFFRFVGEPYSGPLFPTNDKRNPFEVLIPKLMAASEKFDVTPLKDKKSFDPQPWDGSENSLPGKMEDGGYFLKHDAGPKQIVGGTVVRALATRKESDGKFSIYSVETSKADKPGLPALKFEKTHHAIQTTDGTATIVIDGKEQKLTVGELVFVPAGTSFKIASSTSYARVYVFANGGGIGEVLTNVGSKHEGNAVPDYHPETKDVPEVKTEAIKGLQSELGFQIV